METAVDDLVASGHEALARGAWAEARAAFERAAAQADVPEALEGLGMAAWWLEDVATTLDARNRAFRLYREADDRRGAARLATALAWDHFLAGDRVVSRGWLRRAGRLVEACEPGLERGWLAVLEAHVTLMVDHDAAAAERFSTTAAALGRESRDGDLEMLGLAYQGLALVSRGSISEGMQLLDEATAAALVGEIRDPDAAAGCCCALIYACERVYDYPRAAEWCHRLKEMSARWSYRLMLSVCRTHYAGVLLWRGLWTEAEAELVTAVRALEKSRPGEAAEAVVRLADLRCRQGRFDEAAELFARTQTDPLRLQGGVLSLRGRAEMALAQGYPATAANLADRYLRGIGAENRMERSCGLEVLARARARTGELEYADAAAAELAALAADVATEPIRASACLAAGAVAATRGDLDAARHRFEDATDHYQRSGGLFGEASARLHLADVLAAQGSAADAVAEARAALGAFQQLGAAHAASQATALLRRLAGTMTVDLGGPHLTPREVEVLRLLARGLSNKRIAAELVLSVRTVERHVGNVYDKLGLDGSTARAAATAFALTHGLI